MFKYKDLHGYQHTGIDHVIKNTHCALFLEMGLGKTVTTLTVIQKLMYEEIEIDRVLVIAPKRVASSVWDAECEKWEHLKDLRVVKIEGTSKQRRAALQEPGDIYTIGRDNVAWLCGQYGGSMLPFDMLVIDELSSFKNNDAVRFKALRSVQPSFKRVVGLTGTPSPNGLVDLWAQIYLLDRGHRLGKFITKFRQEFFNKKFSGFGYDARQETADKIHALIGDICMSMSAADYLELPERIDNIIKLEFSPETQKIYSDFERDSVLELLEGQQDGDEISALNAAALNNKLQQFANGAVYDEVKNYHVVHDLKIDALKEIIEDAQGAPVLVAYAFKHDRDRIMDALKKYKPVQLKTDDHIKQWNRGEIAVMVTHPASSGHGLNIQAGGNILVWFGQTFSLELYQQFNARLHRQGQKNAVIIHTLAVKGTLDEKIIKALAGKNDVQAELMNAVKALVDKYSPKK